MTIEILDRVNDGYLAYRELGVSGGTPKLRIVDSAKFVELFSESPENLYAYSDETCVAVGFNYKDIKIEYGFYYTDKKQMEEFKCFYGWFVEWIGDTYNSGKRLKTKVLLEDIYNQVKTDINKLVNNYVDWVRYCNVRKEEEIRKINKNR